MNADFPPPGPAGPLDRLGVWMRARKWRQWLVLTAVWFLAFVVLFPAWIAVAILRGSTERDAGAVALNLVLTVFIAVVGLIVVHRATYRWFWHIDRKRAAGLLRPGASEPDYGSELTAPPPRIDWPWSLRLRHALIYIVATATLLYAFAPYENQLAIARFLNAYSAGRTSAGSLALLTFGYLPMAGLSALAVLLTYRQMRRRDTGLLDARQTLLLEAETTWLFSFAAAMVMAALFCRVAGGMIVAYL